MSFTNEEHKHYIEFLDSLNNDELADFLKGRIILSWSLWSTPLILGETLKRINNLYTKNKNDQA